MRLFAAGLLAFFAAVAPASAVPNTVTFSSNTSFDVPAGVTSFSLVAIGGNGGGSGSAVGGRGARVTGTLTVVPGTRLTVDLGGGGAAGTGSSAGGAGGGKAALLQGQTYR